MKTKKTIVPVFYFTFTLLISVFIMSCEKVNHEKDTTGNSEKVENSKPDSEKSALKESPGKELFYLKSQSNNIACADCHSNGTNTENPLTKYFSNIQGANKRTSTYNGKFTGEDVVKNAGGATICWESYEKMKTPLTDEQIKSLNDYYESIAVGAPVEMKYETIALPTRDKKKLKTEQKNVMTLKGDPVKGEGTFKNACATCHGENSIVKKVPGILEDFDGNVKSIVYNVRLGDGAMPFFHQPALTDQELADISAYVLKLNGK